MPTVQCPCIKDTYIDGGNPSINYGTATTLYATRYDINLDGYLKSILVQFNLSQIPESAIIQSATIKLYKTYYSATGSNQYYLDSRLLINSWDEYSANASNISGSSNIHKDTVLTSAINAYMSIDVTDIYRKIHDKTYTNNGFIIHNFANDAGGLDPYYTLDVNFASRETANPPILEVVFAYPLPSIPTNLNPNSMAINRTILNRLAWQHNPGVVGEAQYKYDFRWRVQGTTTWNTTSGVITSNQYKDVAANTFSRAYIEWQVQTYDSVGQASGWSASAVFFAGEKPATPTIVSPTNGGTVNTPNPLVQWSAVSGQTDYNLQLLTTANSLLWETTESANSNSKTIEYSLVHGTSYKIQLRIKALDNIWSDYATITITASYSLPTIPTFQLITNTSRGSISLVITNPSGGAVASSYNEIYRRDLGASEWTKLATLVVLNAVYTDYSAKCGIIHEYKVRAVGINTAYIDSQIQLGSVFFQNAQLALVSDYSRWVELKYSPSGGRNKGYEVTTMQFAGRPKPVAQFGEHINTNLNKSYQLFDKSKLDMLEYICDKQQTVLFRDSRGQSLYGIITGFNPQDELPDYWTVSFNFIEVDYIGGV